MDKLQKLIEIANEGYDGYLTLMKFTKIGDVALVRLINV